MKKSIRIMMSALLTAVLSASALPLSVTAAQEVSAGSRTGEQNLSGVVGDANLDGVINISDSTAIQKYLADFEDLNAVQAITADADGDGFVTISDATEIQKYLAEFTDRFGSSFTAAGVTGNCIWTLDSEGTLAVSGSGNMADYDSPQEAPWNAYTPAVKTVEIKEGVITVGSSSFNGCFTLESVSIPRSVRYIKTDAFYRCESLNAVHISDLAAWCWIEFNDPYTEWFSGYSEDEGYWDIWIDHPCANPLEYAHRLYLNDMCLTDVTIPRGVGGIKKYIFSGCSLNSVTIYPSVAKIDDRAFGDDRDFTVYGASGSAAEIFAEKFNLRFVPISIK